MSFETTPLWNPTSTAPPWDWNPVATGLSAYYTVQKSRRDQEEFELAREMEQYLMPIKQQAAKLELEKVVLDMEKTKAEIDRQRAYTRQATDALRGGPNTQNVGVSRFSPSVYFGTTSQSSSAASSATPSAAPTKRVVGNGVTPKMP